MTVRIDRCGNLRRPDPSGKPAIKAGEAAGSRTRRAAGVRKARRARVFLTREYR